MTSSLCLSRNLLNRSTLVTLRFFHASSVSYDKYDVVVVGGGPGGYVAAIKAAQLGLKTACVESRGSLGGTCLNVGCIPSKALLNSSHKYHEALHSFQEYGVKVSGVQLDLDQMMKQKQQAVKGLTQGIEFLFKKNKVDYVKGFGKITGANQVSVNLNDGSNQVIETSNIIIATGSEPASLPPVPVDNQRKKIVDSTGALELPAVPRRLAVIGGGVIGLEMGSVWGRLGSEVTVIEYLDRIVPGIDSEIATQFMKILKKQKFNFKLGKKVVGSDVSGDNVKLRIEPSKGGEQTTEEFDVVLVATGRRPFTKGLGLDTMGVEMNRSGQVLVNERFQTNIPSIFAIGDVIPGPMLAHKAEEEGIACVEFLAGKHGHVNYDAIPGVIYTHPELASVGKTEEQLMEMKVNYNKGTFPFSANSRARTVNDADGIIKVLSDKETDRIYGIHIIGPNAGEMIAEAGLALEYGASSEDIARTCHAHPTLSEALKEACMSAYDKPIHF